MRLSSCRHCLALLICLICCCSPGIIEAQTKVKVSRNHRSKPMSCVKIGKQKNRGGRSLFPPDDPISTKRGVLIKTGEKQTADKGKKTDKTTSGKTTQTTDIATVDQKKQKTTITTVTTEQKENKTNLTGGGQVPRKPFLNPLYFNFDQDQLTEEDMQTLRTAAGFLQYGYLISLEGHTDNRGTHEYNEELSRKRVEKIREIMIAEIGVPSDKIILKAFGETRPAIHNETPIARQLNRRVEVRIVSTAPQKQEK